MSSHVIKSNLWMSSVGWGEWMARTSGALWQWHKDCHQGQWQRALPTEYCQQLHQQHAFKYLHYWVLSKSSSSMLETACNVWHSFGGFPTDRASGPTATFNLTVWSSENTACTGASRRDLGTLCSILACTSSPCCPKSCTHLSTPLQ